MARAGEAVAPAQSTHQLWMKNASKAMPMSGAKLRSAHSETRTVEPLEAGKPQQKGAEWWL